MPRIRLSRNVPDNAVLSAVLIRRRGDGLAQLEILGSSLGTIQLPGSFVIRRQALASAVDDLLDRAVLSRTLAIVPDEM